ncbi:ankyrin repeat-containing domain protein [Trichoderma pleuroticola]
MASDTTEKPNTSSDNKLVEHGDIPVESNDEPAESSDAIAERSNETDQEIVSNFFLYIAQKQVDVVSNIIANGFVSPDTPNDRGETPLIIAVSNNDAATVRLLVSLGATINGYGSYFHYEEGHQTKVQRTPLQVAAAEGKLGIVKILRELGADDSLIAPDGAMALRLAAENGHREVVEHLPTRRGGAWKRWKVTHEKQMRRIRRILEKIGSVFKFLFWTVPKLLLWTVPKHIITTVPKAIFVTIPKEIWERRHKVGPWCKRQITKFPSRMKKAAKLAGDGINDARKVIQRIPGKIWQILKRIPGAIWTIISWIGKGLGKVGTAAFNILKRVASLIHTTIQAVVGFFRAITLQDIANGFRAILLAIFIDLPKAAAYFATTFGKTSLKVLGYVLGSFGKGIFYAFALVFLLLRWLPMKMWQMLVACGVSIGKGVEELLVWINPKRM